ncbi:hypothetical protein A2160_01715 [Candidatus Beckwithbacteria bacterium RBG_13_42_9]|uniref:ComEC/Rec2-related protein domain-containing protein n=1 Tax=Candidatus Beckwithbacteria bacterium RBG_13_42_9 TaxID=1797457 RepID=A0A1F5E3N3_9BACT|nr:MAG: hypothetical protein A2160_01715 [Candidatus Beckwithbacteria bacterium RBG_13_42_9]
MLNKTIFLLTLFVIFCSLYLLRFMAISETEIIPNKNYSIQGRLSSIKQISDNKWQLKMGGIFIETDKFSNFPQIKLGRHIQVAGRMEKRVINNFYSEFWLINPEITLISESAVNDSFPSRVIYLFIEKIDQFRRFLEKIYERLLPEKEAVLLAGIVLGSQKRLSANLYQALQQSGTLHIMVASGMNVIILGKIVLVIFLKRWRRPIALIASVFTILIYIFLAGAQPPIVRAALMGSLAFASQVFGRQQWGGWVLMLVLAMMLLFSPELLFQVSFQLSAAATAGLIFISPMLDGVLGKVKESFSFGFSAVFGFFKINLTETLAAQLAVLPLLSVHFGQFNLLTILPNLLIAPIIPLLMQGGLVLLALGSISSFLGQVFAWAIWAPLRYIIVIVELFGQVKWLTIYWYWPWWLAFWWWGGLALLMKTRRRNN